MNKRNRLILLFLVIILLIVITFLILFNYFIKFSTDNPKKDGQVNIYIVDKDKNDKNSGNKNTETKNDDKKPTGVLETIKNFFTGNNGNDKNDNTGSNSNNGNTGDSGNEEEEKPDVLDVYIEPVVPTDGYTGFIQADSDKIWDSENDLNIFKNPKRGGKSIIYPGAYNAYHFQILNKTEYPFNYSLTFNEENIHKINMLFRIKKNDEYINNKWSKISDIYLEVSSIDVDEVDDYVLEWKWFDGANDTYIGLNSDKISYNLSLKVFGYSDLMEEEEIIKE